MDYELRTIPGCSNSRPALELFRRVLAAEGADERNPPDRGAHQAEELDFHGSPSFIADGRYLFTSTASPALTCRVYPSKIGLTGLPSLEDLRAAVRARSSEDGIPG
jgi:hypothetical protein